MQHGDVRWDEAGQYGNEVQSIRMCAINFLFIYVCTYVCAYTHMTVHSVRTKQADNVGVGEFPHQFNLCIESFHLFLLQGTQCLYSHRQHALVTTNVLQGAKQ